MLNFVDTYMQRISGKVSSSELEVLHRELVSLTTYYDIAPKSTALAVYEGYLPEEYKAFIVAKKVEGKSDETLANYALRLKDFFRYLNKPVQNITANDIRAYLYTYQKEHGVSNRTLDHIRSVLGGFFGWCAGEGYTDRDVSLVIKPIKYERKQRGHLTPYELEQLRYACQNLRDEALVEVLFSTGCRVTELIRLDISDVDFENEEVLLFGKGDKHRKSYLTPRAVLSLQKYLSSRDDDCPALFVWRRKPHNRMSKAGIEKVISGLGVRAGINHRVYPHLIRHTTATIALQKGMDITEIQKLLGHTNVSTTMIYTDVSKDSVRAAHHKYIA